MEGGILGINIFFFFFFLNITQGVSVPSLPAPTFTPNSHTILFLFLIPISSEWLSTCQRREDEDCGTRSLGAGWLKGPERWAEAVSYRRWRGPSELLCPGEQPNQ